jgi:transcriptional regulator with XRE-family HTH domain
MNGWTKADIARLREVMIGQGRGIDEIADEVRAVCNVTRLASYRLAHGLSQPQAVARCRRYAQGNGLDQPTLSRLEQFPARGSRTPLAVQLIALATAYGTQPLRLLTPDSLDRLDPREREVIVRLAGGSVSEHDTSEQAELAGLAGLAFSGAAAPATAPMAVPVVSIPAEFNRRAPGRLAGAARRAFGFSALAEGSNVGPETLAELESEVRRLAAEYPQQAIGPLVQELAQLQDIGFRLLEGRQRPQQTASLYLFTGIVCGMLAKASHDLGDAGSAMTQARTAYICADNSDHDGLRTWVRGLQSLICYWAGWSQDALRYARLGAEPGRTGPGSAAVWIAAQEARAWGMVGNEAATLAALDRGRRARDLAAGDELDEIGGVLAFPPARQLYYAADALAAVPEQQVAAENYARQAISEYEQLSDGLRSFSDEAGARCDLALARIRLGDAAGAQEAIGPVLELPAPRRINGVIASAHRVAAAAAGLSFGVERVRLQEAIHAFCLSPAREAGI